MSEAAWKMVAPRLRVAGGILDCACATRVAHAFRLYARPPCAKRCASVDETLVDPDHLASGLLLGRNNNFRPGQYVIPLKPSIGPRGVP